MTATMLRPVLFAGALSALFSVNVQANDLFGAIAYSLEARVYGYAENYRTRGEAEMAALNACQNEVGPNGPACTVELWFKNAYGALAEGDNGFGTGWGQYKQDAQWHALQTCKRYTTNCDISLTVGTD